MPNLELEGQTWLPSIRQAVIERGQAQAVVDALIDGLIPAVDRRQRNQLSDAITTYVSTVELEAAARLMAVVQALCSTPADQREAYVPAPLVREREAAT
jgi:hypothetical protein